MKPYVSIKEASESTGLSYYAIRQMVLSGKIKYIKSGVKVYVNTESLLSYYDGGVSK